jgi:hypothetical protein
MSKFAVYGHYHPLAKSFVFVTSQMLGEENLSEYFFIVNERNSNVITGGLSFRRPKEILELECPQEDKVEFCFNHAREMGETAVGLIFMDKYFNDQTGGNGQIDERYGFGFNQMAFCKADLGALLQYSPSDTNFEFIYQTQNESLKRYLEVFSNLRKRAPLQVLK